MPYDLRLLGRPIVIYKTATSAGAGATAIEVKPPSMKLWLVSLLYGYHAAGANRNATWRYTDPVTDADLFATTSLATGTRWYFNLEPTGNNNIIFGPIVSQFYRYPKFVWTATGAAEVGYVYGVALEIDVGVG